MNSSTLFLVDLDHTLIYGSFASSETADLLFEYSQYLKVYERPHARALIRALQEKGDIIVYTTAKEDYAELICKHLSINQKKLLSRKNCSSQGERYFKEVKKKWSELYPKIVIVDDSPQVWITSDVEVNWLVPKEFRGNKEDSELLILIDKLEQILG